MPISLPVGTAVQTPLGKGVIREHRNAGCVLVDVRGRSLVFGESQLTALKAEPGARRHRTPTPDAEMRSAPVGRGGRSEIDLHGLTVDAALVRVEEALSDALLADVSEVRLIHGRTGGRIRAALHRRLREIPTVKSFRIDPRNDGVTIAQL